MSNFFANVAKVKWENMTSTKTKPFHTKGPIGMSQGSTFAIDAIPFVIAQASKVVFPTETFVKNQMFTSVGVLDFGDFTVYRGYLRDGISFLEVIVKPGNLTDVNSIRLYTLENEAIISSPDARDFFLGKAPTYHEEIVNGPITAECLDGLYRQEVADPDSAVEALIGWGAFQVNPKNEGDEPILFDRLWSPGEESINPLEINETVYFADGSTEQRKHYMMQYGRNLGKITEYLYADYTESHQGSVMGSYVGLDISSNFLTILSTGD